MGYAPTEQVGKFRSDVRSTLKHSEETQLNAGLFFSKELDEMVKKLINTASPSSSLAK